MVCAPTFAKCAGHERPKASPEGEKAAAPMEAREDRQLARNLVHWTSPPHPRVAKAPIPSRGCSPARRPFPATQRTKGVGASTEHTASAEQAANCRARGTPSSTLGGAEFILCDAANRGEGGRPQPKGEEGEDKRPPPAPITISGGVGGRFSRGLLSAGL